jgi:hypothetical protein
MNITTTTTTTRRFLCVYGHFYQPPREDPFTGKIPPEPGSGSHTNFNAKITHECYRPNAARGNFARISFDLGPTLAAWLEAEAPDVYARIIAADQGNVADYGVGNALAQAYNHTILPLATPRDKRTQIAWGLADFEHRFGHPAEGMWLAETAVDMQTLDILAEHGVRYTVLAPWQAAEPIDPTEPYLVPLEHGRSIAVFFYNGPLSGAVSFDGETTMNADAFAKWALSPHLNREKVERGTDQLITVATDGELYGHHKAYRDQFLSYLVGSAAAAHGFEVVSLGRYLRAHPATRTVRLTTPSAWSCGHGVARWSAGCLCTEGVSTWKPALRAALDRLAGQLNATFERFAGATLRDPWEARDAYIALRNGRMSPDAFWERYGRKRGWRRDRKQERTALDLLEAQFFGQYMYTSCGFFFEDLDRIEPRNDIAFARRALSLTWRATDVDLQASFVADLAAAKSGRTGLSGADLYRQLPGVEAAALPPLPRALAGAEATDESAA